MGVSLILYYRFFAFDFQICKDMFLKTLDISQSMVTKALEKHDEDGHQAPEAQKLVELTTKLQMLWSQP